MNTQIAGIHHITAIASAPQRNVDFYTGVLGLRLVKITINYDDPGSYHFYYGDEAGSPGSILTFFAWPGGRRGRRGTAQATTTAFSVPAGSLDYWQTRFDQHQVACEPVVTRWNEEALTFYDPDGLQLQLVAPASKEGRDGKEGQAQAEMSGANAAWKDGPIPAEFATRGFHSIALSVRNAARTAALLTETMGFHLVQEDGERTRYAAGEAGRARIVDVLQQTAVPQGAIGVGNVHHVAWRTPDDAQQGEWHAELARQRYQVSPVMDRQYFHSIYFQEPGGILFEIATDLPGFTTDENLSQLGTGLRLPDWLEPRRIEIQRALPALRLPNAVQKS